MLEGGCSLERCQIPQDGEIRFTVRGEVFAEAAPKVVFAGSEVGGKPVPSQQDSLWWIAMHLPEVFLQAGEAQARPVAVGFTMTPDARGVANPSPASTPRPPKPRREAGDLSCPCCINSEIVGLDGPRGEDGGLFRLSRPAILADCPLDGRQIEHDGPERARRHQFSFLHFLIISLLSLIRLRPLLRSATVPPAMLGAIRGGSGAGWAGVS